MADSTADDKNDRSVASKPFGSFLLDQLRLFSPFTWWGVAKLRQIDVCSSLFKSFIGLLAPVLCYQWTYRLLLLLSNNNNVRLPEPNKQLLWYYLLSPWTVWMVLRAGRTIFQVAKATYQYRTMRAKTLPDAWETLAERIRKQRAYRTRRYDVYLPPKMNDETTEAILFLPGAGVQDVAYAGPAALLSDQGYLVVVLSAEPLRMAFSIFGTTVAAMRRIQRHIQRKHNKTFSWSLLGHSLGSFAASQVASDLDIDRLVFWASNPGFSEYLSDLSSTPAHVLVVQGSKDVVIQEFSTPQSTQAYWNKLPQSARERVIQGGTHSGFASYVSSFRPETDDDLPRAQQHAQAVHVTVDFLIKTKK